MKKYIPLLLVSLSVSLSSAIAQLSGGNLFLKGNYLEVGFQGNGAMGATSGVPAGYHPHMGVTSTTNTLACVYDYDRDGWAVGSPSFMGDYICSDSIAIYEGWGIQIGGARTYAQHHPSSGPYVTHGGGIGMTGSNASYNTIGARTTGVWSGSAMGGQLAINKEMYVENNGTSLKINVRLKNLGTTALPNIYYFRSCDPDNEYTWPSGTPYTNNTIVHQDAISNKHYIQATAITHASTIGLGAKDSRAKVFFYYAWPLGINYSLDSIHNGTNSDIYQNPGLSTGPSSDAAIGISFSLGTLAPGDSTDFSYAYMFAGAASFDSVFAVTCSGTPTAGSVSANTNSACNTSSIHLYLTGSSFFSGMTYQWQSSTDSMSWANIPAATGDSYTFSGLIATTFFRCLVTCSGSGLSNTTAGKKITYTTICPCIVQNAGIVMPSTLFSCDTATISINNSGYTALPTIGLQWQSSPDSVTWTDIVGATSVPYTFSGLLSTTYYRLKTTCSATGAVATSAGKKITYIPVCVCTGAPVVATAVASSSYCSSCALTLSLSGITAMAGTTYQWERSLSGAVSSWWNIYGATNATYTHSPTETFYYRCNISCSGATTASNSILVITPHSITADSVTLSPDTTCTGQKFFVRVSGTSPLMSIKTYFGDGTSSINPLIVSGSSVYASIAHTYLHPLSYTVKHVLYCDTMAQDSVTFIYNQPYCNLLSARFYTDRNSDCIKNSGEIFMQIPLKVRIDSAGVALDTLTATSGLYYKALGPAGTVYSFTLLSTNVYPVCPSSGIYSDILVSGTYTYPTHYYALNCSSTDFDLVVFPSFSAHTDLSRASMIVQNWGCAPQTAVVDYTFSNKYRYAGPAFYNTPVAAATADHALNWNRTGLNNMSSSFLISSRVNKNTALPALVMGDTAFAKFAVSPIIGDIDTTNNIIIINDTIKGPYDPNMIEVLPPGCYDNDTTLQYTVLFENKGNDTAHNVYVMDTLSDNLVANSLEVLAASADMFTHEYKDGPYHIVRFDFPGIKLLDSSWFGLNAGMFVFKIKTKPGLANGQMIHNRVGIYFDNNEVIMTNTASNIKGCPTTLVKNINTTDDVLLYPNPVTDVLTIVAQPSSYTTLTITNAVGQQIVQQNITLAENKVNVKNLPPGVYSITLSGAQHNVTKRFVKW